MYTMKKRVINSIKFIFSKKNYHHVLIFYELLVRILETPPMPRIQIKMLHLRLLYFLFQLEVHHISVVVSRKGSAVSRSTAHRSSEHLAILLQSSVL